jgi:hypothetical protein
LIDVESFEERGITLEEDTTVEHLYDKKSSYDPTSLALVGGVGKIGVGFSDSTLDIIIFATEIGSEDNEMIVRQVSGRIRKGTIRVIDIEDDMSVCIKHARVRKKVCVEDSSEKGTTLRYPKRGRLDLTDNDERNKCLEKIKKFMIK